jgi:hypothetical protein
MFLFAQSSLRISQMQFNENYERVFFKEVLQNGIIEISTAGVEITNFDADVFNFSDKENTYNLSLTVTDTTEGINISACWGNQCNIPWNFNFTPRLLTSTETMVFSVDYFAPSVLKALIEGKAFISIVITNVDDANDIFTFFIKFTPDVTSITEKNPTTAFQKPYPNPASSLLHVKYQLDKQYNNAKISLCNILGIIVEEKTISEKESELLFDVSRLPQGIYFCTIKVGNMIVDTKKIVVTH